MSLLSLLVSSTLRKKIWTFHEPVGQGGQGWLKGFSPPWPWLELLLALGLHFPTCKMGGGGVSVASQPIARAPLLSGGQV